MPAFLCLKRRRKSRRSQNASRAELVTVIEDIARIEGPKDPNEEGAVYLTDEAKKLCWQLFGPPPGHPDYSEPEAASPTENGRKTKKGRSK